MIAYDSDLWRGSAMVAVRVDGRHGLGKTGSDGNNGDQVTLPKKRVR